MVLNYITSYFSTLMILFMLMVIMFVNRKSQIPAAALFRTCVLLIFAISVFDFMDEMTTGGTGYTYPFELMENRVWIRLLASTMNYVLRPIVILLELIIICPSRKAKALVIIPSVINAAVYLPALFGSHISFWIDENNNWQSSFPLGRTVYVVQLIYVALLIILSIKYFHKDNVLQSLIIVAIAVLSVAVAIFEFTDLLTGYATPVTALCALGYYIYLSMIYQQAMRKTLAEKELDIARSELAVLRSQMQPHFIYNSLSTIRSLTKRDSERAVKCIDDFSKYLKSHIGAIQNEGLVPFKTELENVKVYMSMVQAGYSKDIVVDYDLQVTDFEIPPLSLEPIVENAVEHGVGRYGGTVKIQTFEKDGYITVRVKDEGKKANTEEEYKPVHNGIGLKNTEKRIQMQCSGSLVTDFAPTGATVDIVIPAVKEEKE